MPFARKRVELLLPVEGPVPAVTVTRGQPVDIILIRPKLFAFVVPDENFRLERAVWLPDHDDPTPGDDEPATGSKGLRPGLALAAAVWAYAREFPNRHVVVAGHTDASGSASFNTSLSQLRAEQVQLYLAGEFDAWADHAHENAQVDDLQAALAWAARGFEIDCDPGDIDNDWGPLTAGALGRFRSWYEAQLGLTRPSSERGDRQDWLAIVAAYDLAVRRALAWSAEDLDTARSQLTWHDAFATVACGESWPSQAPETGSAAENRRVEVLFAQPDHLPGSVGSPDGATLYDNTRYKWNWLEADELWMALGSATRNDVHLTLLSNSGRHALANCSCELETPSGTESATTDDQGRLHIPRVEAGYHKLTVTAFGQPFTTEVPTVAAGTGPYLHRVAGASYDQDA